LYIDLKDQVDYWIRWSVFNVDEMLITLTLALSLWERARVRVTLLS